jgi:hypothetical protein
MRACVPRSRRTGGMRQIAETVGEEGMGEGPGHGLFPLQFISPANKNRLHAVCFGSLRPEKPIFAGFLFFPDSVEKLFS